MKQIFSVFALSLLVCLRSWGAASVIALTNATPNGTPIISTYMGPVPSLLTLTNTDTFVTIQSNAGNLIIGNPVGAGLVIQSNALAGLSNFSIFQSNGLLSLSNIVIPAFGVLSNGLGTLSNSIPALSNAIAGGSNLSLSLSNGLGTISNSIPALSNAIAGQSNFTAAISNGVKSWSNSLGVISLNPNQFDAAGKVLNLKNGGSATNWTFYGQNQFVGNTIFGSDSNSVNQFYGSIELSNLGYFLGSASGPWAVTANRVSIWDANRVLMSSSITTTELGYLSGVTGGIQTNIDNRLPFDGTNLIKAQINGVDTQSRPIRFTNSASATFGTNADGSVYLIVSTSTNNASYASISTTLNTVLLNGTNVGFAVASTVLGATVTANAIVTLYVETSGGSGVYNLVGRGNIGLGAIVTHAVEVSGIVPPNSHYYFTNQSDAGATATILANSAWLVSITGGLSGGGGGGGSGTVTSVALTMPSDFSVAGSPITTSGTLAVTAASQAANLVKASPNGSSGVPTYRNLVTADVTNFVTFTFTNNGTFTNSGYQSVTVIAAGAGGGGGGGYGTNATTVVRHGGTSGGGGSYKAKTFLATDLSATVAITVGAGGIGGGGSVSGGNTNGQAGGVGGNSSFGAYLTAYGGGGGKGGPGTPANGPGGSGAGTAAVGVVGSGTASVAGGAPDTGVTATAVGGHGAAGVANGDGGSAEYGGAGGGGVGSTGGSPSGNGGGSSLHGGAAGGPGGQVSASNTQTVGAAGGSQESYTSGTGAAGGAAGGSAGSPGVNGFTGPGSGGGGGGGANATTGGAGGSGGAYGNGGGGGGGGTSTGGNGGRGGVGVIIVICR